MVTVARQLPPYSASVLGNWPVAQWSAFARSSQLRRLLPPHVSAQLPRSPSTHTSSLLPLLGNTFRHLCLPGISLARVGRPRPAALVLVGSEGSRATDATNYWISLKSCLYYRHFFNLCAWFLNKKRQQQQKLAGSAACLSL